MGEQDLFRLKPYEISDAQKAKVQEIKQKAKELLEIIQNDHTLIDGKRHYKIPQDYVAIELASTKLEECVMWAVKGNTKKNNINNN